MKTCCKRRGEKLQASLDICHMYMAQYGWRNLMKKIDHNMSNTDTIPSNDPDPDPILTRY